MVWVVRDEEGAGDEEKSEGKPLLDIDDGQHAQDHEADALLLSFYPVTRFKVFIITARFLTPILLYGLIIISDKDGGVVLVVVN